MFGQKELFSKLDDNVNSKVKVRNNMKIPIMERDISHSKEMMGPIGASPMCIIFRVFTRIFSVWDNSLSMAMICRSVTGCARSEIGNKATL